MSALERFNCSSTQCYPKNVCLGEQHIKFSSSFFKNSCIASIRLRYKNHISNSSVCFCIFDFYCAKFMILTTTLAEFALGFAQRKLVIPQSFVYQFSPCHHLCKYVWLKIVSAVLFSLLIIVFRVFADKF